MSDQNSNTKHIGCFIASKKKEVLQWNRFVELARNKHIMVHDLDLSTPLSFPFKLDLVITKFNAELNARSGDNPDPKSELCINNYSSYVSSHPDLVQLDPLQCQDKLTTRPKMLELFYQLTDKMKELHVPLSVVLNEGDPLLTNFPFPAICKTLEAVGAMSSHEMTIIWDENGLIGMNRPILLQQLINHSSTIFKIYVIGTYYYVVKRPSIRNFSSEESNGKPIHFNSQQFKSLQGNPVAPLPPQSLMDSLVAHLRNDLGLTLIGLDIITCSSTGVHYIIDANYFPGYTDAEDGPQRFLDLVENKLNSSF